MSGTLEVYRDYARRPGRLVSTSDLRRAGFSAAHARVTLHRLRAAGLAKQVAPGKVRLLLPHQAAIPTAPPVAPWERQLLASPAKATGFAVLPQRYPSPRPKEYVVPPKRLQRVAQRLRETHPDLRVYVNEYHAEDAVCLYAGRVRGKKAATEEALLHLYRHAPRPDFALALQSVLMDHVDLNWGQLRRHPEWNELAAVFVALNDRVRPPPFPAFRTDEAPDLSVDELDTVAQAFAARGALAPPRNSLAINPARQRFSLKRRVPPVNPKRKPSHGAHDGRPPEARTPPPAKIGAAPATRHHTDETSSESRPQQRSDYAFFKSIAPGTMKAMAEAEADDD